MPLHEIDDSKIYQFCIILKIEDFYIKEKVLLIYIKGLTKEGSMGIRTPPPQILLKKKDNLIFNIFVEFAIITKILV